MKETAVAYYFRLEAKKGFEDWTLAGLKYASTREYTNHVSEAINKKIAELEA